MSSLQPRTVGIRLRQRSGLTFVLVAALLLVVPPPAHATTGDVTTIAGTGVGGFAGDGGPATAADIHGPRGIAVAPDGTIYFADNYNYRIRRVSPTGIITTIAGNGNVGDTGDGGLAVNATLSGVLSIALSPAADGLYIADVDNSRVRRVDLSNGIITNFAGTGSFGFSGDGGLATNATLALPEGVAVNSDGSVYIADVLNCVIRKVDVTNVITTVAGNGTNACPAAAATGDGGDALGASFGLPRRVTVDDAGNIFVLDAVFNTIRRIDHATNQITTVAGGGTTIPGFGPATDMNLGNAADIVTDAAGQLYIANDTQVFKVDLASGLLSVFAGTGVAGSSGDGGPATAALFNDLGGLAFTPAGALLIGDAGNNRIRSIEPAPAAPVDALISLLTSQAFLDSLLALPGNLAMVNVGGRDLLVIPNLASVGLDVTVTGNDQLLVVDLRALQSAGGNIDIAGNLAMTSLDLSALTTVGGNLSLTGDPNLSAILISGVTTIGGNLSLIGTAATAINLPALSRVNGNINISANPSATAIDLGSLATVGGSLTVDDNTASSAIDLGSLATVGGSLSVADNGAAGAIDLGLLGSTSGSLNIDRNTSASAIDLGSLATVGGSLSVDDNTASAVVNLDSLATVGGSLSVDDNGASAAVDLGSLTSVGGSLTVDSTGSGTFTEGNNAQVDVDLTLDTTGYTTVGGTTAGGATSLTNTTADAVMRLQIAAATFNAPVSFAVTHLGPAALAPEAGLGAGGGPASIDPLAGYQFTFGVPTLNRDASLSFDVNVAALDAASQAQLLAGVAAGTATLATKSDAAGSAYQAFPVCSGSAQPSVDGCVSITGLDANGVAIAAGDPTIPTVVRFTGVVGHFSTWAVVTATPSLVDVTPPVFSNVPADIIAEATSAAGAVVSYTAPTATDAISGPAPAVCAPASGATYALGTTPVSCTATDAAGNIATATFNVSVADTTAPAISAVPANITITAATGANGAVATWATPTATDLVSGARPVACLPASGSTFAIGASTVTCTASDGAANTASATFTVTVAAAPPPPPAGGQIKVLHATLGGARFLDLDTFAFTGVKGEKVTVRLAADPAGSYTNGGALLTLLGNGVHKADASALPNVVTTTLPKTGTYYVTVSELLKTTGKFTGAYTVSLESSLNAHQSFVQK